MREARWRRLRQRPDDAGGFYADFYALGDSGDKPKRHRAPGARARSAALAVVASLVRRPRRVLLPVLGVAVVGSILMAAITVMATGAGTGQAHQPGLVSASDDSAWIHRMNCGDRFRLAC